MAGRWARPHATSVVVALVGVLVTATLTVAAWMSNESNEDQLLEERVREAAAVLDAAIPAIQTQLAVAARLLDPDDFEDALDPLVTEDGSFVSASIWPANGITPVAVVGEPPALAEEPPERVRDFLTRSASASTMTVIELLDGRQPRLGYAFTNPEDSPRFVTYAESALPEDRTAVTEPNSAFNDLDYAIYIGEQEDEERLLVASASNLPLKGRRATERVPLGDTELLLVMAPTEQLGGGLLAMLPFAVGGVGLAASAMAGLLLERLQRRRDEAEELAGENARLYEEQRNVAHTLQHSLLPQRLPRVGGVETAVRYVPGVRGMEIGGDWYDVIALGPERLLAVVGDVSGRGLRAASLMASIRYSARAFASQGDSPSTILGKLNAIDDPDREGHFTTVLCARLDLDAMTVTLATAGHPFPLLLGASGSRFVMTTVGPPIGVVRGAAYDEAETSLDEAATLLLFTDGLFERRGETVEDGLARLRQSAERQEGSLQQVINGVVDDLIGGAASDDAAILGLRWGPNRSDTVAPLDPEQSERTDG